MHTSTPLKIATPIFLMSCFDGKSYEDDEDEYRREGESKGDCIDGIDNDGDGDQDCDDSGCEERESCNLYTGGYETARCSDYDGGNGYAVGNISMDFELMDQHGDMVKLSDFCGKTILLEGAAGW